MYRMFCSLQDKVQMIVHYRISKQPAPGEKHCYSQNVESLCKLLIIAEINVRFNRRAAYMPERAAFSEPNFTFGYFAIIHICVRALSCTWRQDMYSLSNRLSETYKSALCFLRFFVPFLPNRKKQIIRLVVNDIETAPDARQRPLFTA